MKPPVILITGECYSRICRIVNRLLADSGFTPISVFNLRNLKSEVLRHQPSVAVCVSHQRDPAEALKPLSMIRETANGLPTILIAGQSSELLAIAALRAVVDDYFKNLFSDSDLLSSCRLFSGAFASGKADGSPCART
jgi:DNA-binding response OmpR family regulator